MRLGLLIISILLTCGQNKKTDDKVNDCLPDNLFVVTNIKESFSLDDVPRESGGRRCSYKSKQLKEMDSLQIVKLLFPFLGDNAKPSYWVADFVSKQEKIGDIQPIIVRVEGFEYITLWYLLVDSNCNLKGYFNVEKCEYDEGWANHPIGEYCKIQRRSKFNKDIIETYEIRETDFKDNKFTIDSLTYRTTIDLNGKLNTKRTDSVRVTKRWTE